MRISREPKKALRAVSVRLWTASPQLLRMAGIKLNDVAAVGLDSPGPASAEGVLSLRGSTNFLHSDWCGFDIPGSLSKALNRPVTYLNAGALWDHFVLFGGSNKATSVSAIIGAGLGGGVIAESNVVKGRRGYGRGLGTF